MKIKSCVIFFSAVTLYVFSVASVSAKEHPKGPCGEDVKKFCKDVEPGGGRILKCLKEHEAELSAQCKAMKKRAGRAAKAKHKH